MDGMLDLFIGDPVYDEQKNVIRRDFGVKNIVAIMVVGFIGYSLMGEMKSISGKGKMKGGASSADALAAVVLNAPLVLVAFMLYGMFVCPTLYIASNRAGGLKYLGKYKEEWRKCAIYTWSAVGIYTALLLLLFAVERISGRQFFPARKVASE